MATYTQILYHIVFSTKDRKPCLLLERRPELFRYISGIIKNKNCHLYRVNGAEDHLHFLTGLHPTICLADFVKDIKTGASKWIKTQKIFPEFRHWQEGYGAFTLAIDGKDALIEYIKNQEEHHRQISFREELQELLKKASIDFDEKYLL